MSDQTALEGTGTPTPPEVRLTARQRRALEAVAERGPISSAELGRAISDREWSSFDEASGASVGAALRKKGLVRFSRKADGWLLRGAPDPRPPSSDYDPASAEIPF